MGKRHFDAEYLERATLADGSEVILRLVRPQDKELFRRGFKAMSERTRYYRFFGYKKHLNHSELEYLTELDHDNHFAIGAMSVLPDGSEEGLAVARFVRLSDEPDTADPAIVVVDHAQGKGLGRLLFLRLVAAARERGIVVFRSEVLAENKVMRKLLYETAEGQVEEHPEGEGVLVIKLALPDVRAADPPDTERGRDAAYRLLSYAAQGLVRVAQVLHLLPRVDLG
jgi:GNAT superfamily N-acetyltransferase